MNRYNLTRLSAATLGLCLSAPMAFAINGVQHYTPVVNEAGLLTLHRSSYGDASRLGIGLNYNLAIDPQEVGDEKKFNNYLHSLNLGVGSKLAERIHVYGDVSVHYLAPIGDTLNNALSDAGENKFVLGNIDLGMGYTVVNNDAGGLGFAVVPHVVLPVGSKNLYLDGPRNANEKRTFEYGVALAGDYKVVNQDLAVVNLGWDRRNTNDFLTWGFGYQKSLWGSSHSVILEVRGENNMDQDRLAEADPVEADLAYRGYCHGKTFAYTAGMGRGFNNNSGSPDLRAMLGVNWQWDKKPEREEPAPMKEEAAKPAPAPAPKAVEEKVAMQQRTLKVSKIYFANNKDEILEKSYPALDKLSADLAANPGLKKLTVEGHTDNTGNADYNRDLSKRRAESVKKYLLAHGVAENRLTTEGFGPDQPLEANTTPAGRAKNRRVEFRIVEVDGPVKIDLTE